MPSFCLARVLVGRCSQYCPPRNRRCIDQMRAGLRSLTTDITDSSLFGRWWSSAFRLTTPLFVARGPALLFGISRWLSQHGISRKRRNNLTRVLIAVERSTQESKANSSHPSSREGHRCAGLWFCRSDSLAFVVQIVGAISFVQRNSVPSLHMRCIITASRRASATMAFFCPRRLAMFIAHAFSHDHFCTRVSMTCAAS